MTELPEGFSRAIDERCEAARNRSIEQLAERVEHLEWWVRPPSVEAKRAGMRPMRDTVEDHRGQIAALQANLNDLAKRLDDLASAVNGLSAVYGRLAGRVDELAKGLKRVASRDAEAEPLTELVANPQPVRITIEVDR